MTISPIIQVADLLKMQHDGSLVLVDASAGPDAYKNYIHQHLKGAIYVDLNTKLAKIGPDAAIGGRHPLPPVKEFADTLGQLGITPESHVVVYDDKLGANAAARFWWMLHAVGHHHVQVLNGGSQEALKLGYAISGGEEHPVATMTYPADKWILPTVEMVEVDSAARSIDHIVVDVRDSYRYDGISEPIDLIAGHIPGAINIPFVGNLNADGTFQDSATLREMYAPLFSDKEPEDVIVHCGSGVTACHTILAMAIAELPIPALYVGSWSEWSRNDKPIATR